ncbi:2-oxoglutarate and iron-dependent oxygenase domain-containing protein 3 isoform X4 [Apis cerana]|uniref:2-oxoglutarate and iron-dependent oxygenase domain-containing protein 3 isoform X4 n=1 Tax=Apis cerana TaxID=7461 RepID=UPI002B2392DC|nr:2-oxoglutarate and iron-dependent oxygenase domain-containing protein 3 isoform X4 [Apis cerana]
MTQEVKKGKKKQVEKENQKEKKFEKNIKENTVENIKVKYGSSIRFPYQRVWSRFALIFPVLFIVWYSSKQGKEIYLAKQKEILLSRTLNIECSSDYEAETNKYPECVPEKCGSDGGASILDLHSGALSKGQGFIDIYSLSETKKIFNSSDFAIYKTIKTKIQHAIAHNFGISSNKIFLTKPTFFSRMTNISAKTIHDEYWHPHIDKDTYKSFHYTTLLYLNDFGRDFEGGRFVFIDKNNVKTIIEPRKGRLSMFTSGSENLHAVEKVQSGTRYALTISFTCNPDAAISDPDYRIK